MRIEIFDVELGQCAVIHCPNGQKIMIDAGHNSSRPWYPSEHFRGAAIERFVVSNYDEDHMSDFADLMNTSSIRTIFRNGSITSSQLLSMKTLPLGQGIKRIYDWLRDIETPGGGVCLPTADLAGVELTHYANPYGTFTDTNNLSLVTFVKYGNFKILFPGDLEIAGWRELLKNPSFRLSLNQLTVLVASHHGRENGCCAEVFDCCAPMTVIISDGDKQHDTQETTNWYASKASGCNTIGRIQRKVLTTRSDGNLTIEVDTTGAWRIATEAEKNSLLVRY